MLLNLRHFKECIKYKIQITEMLESRLIIKRFFKLNHYTRYSLFWTRKKVDNQKMFLSFLTWCPLKTVFNQKPSLIFNCTLNLMVPPGKERRVSMWKRKKCSISKTHPTFEANSHYTQQASQVKWMNIRSKLLVLECEHWWKN